MTVRVVNAADEEEAETKVKKLYQGFDYILFKKVKKDEEENGYFYWFEIADQNIL